MELQAQKMRLYDERKQKIDIQTVLEEEMSKIKFIVRQHPDFGRTGCLLAESPVHQP